MVDPELFSRFVPLDSLADGNRNKLAQSMELRDAPAGEILFRAGDTAGPTLYLVSGTVQLEDDIGRRITVRAGELTSRHPLAPAAVRRVLARCTTDCRLLLVDRDLLDVMLTWDQGHALELGEHEKVGADSEDWMIRLLQLSIFRRVPPANLYEMFKRVRAIDASAGQVILCQDDEGDYFYIIVAGRCSVTRRGPDGRQIGLAELDVGDCFGEEALISEEPRNATVRMLTAGRLMRLAKSDFRELLTDSMDCVISPVAALEKVASGKARWLDVRLAAEFRCSHLTRSINLPLHLLRLKLKQLDRNIEYVAVCDTGRRSSIAAWLLNQRGYTAYRLESGLPADV